MIQATGIISKMDNKIQYVNPLINIKMISDNKFSKTKAFIETGTIVEYNKIKMFKSLNIMDIFSFDIKNPSFNEIQELVKAKLKELYPEVAFDII
jgi:hypothetical protein